MLTDMTNLVWQLLLLILGVAGLVACVGPLFSGFRAGYKWAFCKLFRRVKVTFVKEKK